MIIENYTKNSVEKKPRMQSLFFVFSKAKDIF